MTLTLPQIKQVRGILEWDWQNDESRSDGRLGGVNITRRCAYCGEYYDADHPFQGHRTNGAAVDCLNRLLWDALESGAQNQGDDILNALRFETAPTSDLNQLGKGRWYVAAPTNGPGGVAGGVLVDSGWDPASPGPGWQKLVAQDNSKIYHRTTDGTTWTVWRRTDATTLTASPMRYATGPPTSNLNILTVGRWQAGGVTNGPAGETGLLLIDNSKEPSSLDSGIQVATRADGSKQFRRVFTGGAWQAWAEVAGAAVSPSILYGTAPGTDYGAIGMGRWVMADGGADAPAVGIYYLESAFDPANPASGGVQVASQSNGAAVYQRSHNGTQWSTWRRTDPEQADPLYYIPVTGTQSLDVTEVGRWALTNPTDGPAGITGVVLVDSGYSAARPTASAQVLTTADGTKRFSRTWTGAAWTDWVEVGAPSAGVETVTQVAHGYALTAGQPLAVFEAADGLWSLARADSDATLATGLIVGVPDLNTFLVQRMGAVSIGVHGRRSEAMWLSGTVAGQVDTSPPAAGSGFAQFLGLYLGTDEAVVVPSPGFQFPATTAASQALNVETGAVWPTDTSKVVTAALIQDRIVASLGNMYKTQGVYATIADRDAAVIDPAAGFPALARVDDSTGKGADEWALFMRLSAADVWFEIANWTSLANAAALTQFQAEAVGGGSHTAVGLVSSNLLDLWGASRARPQVLTGDFDYHGQGWPIDSPRLFVNADFGFSVMLDIDATKPTVVYRSGETPNEIAAGATRYRVPPGVSAIVWHDASRTSVQILSSRLRGVFTDRAALATTLPHNGLSTGEVALVGSQVWVYSQSSDAAESQFVITPSPSPGATGRWLTFDHTNKTVVEHTDGTTISPGRTNHYPAGTDIDAALGTLTAGQEVRIRVLTGESIVRGTEVFPGGLTRSRDYLFERRGGVTIQANGQDDTTDVTSKNHTPGETLTDAKDVERAVTLASGWSGPGEAGEIWKFRWGGALPHDTTGEDATTSAGLLAMVGAGWQQQGPLSEKTTHVRTITTSSAFPYSVNSFEIEKDTHGVTFLIQDGVSRSFLLLKSQGLAVLHNFAGTDAVLNDNTNDYTLDVTGPVGVTWTRTGNQYDFTVTSLDGGPAAGDVVSSTTPIEYEVGRFDSPLTLTTVSQPVVTGIDFSTCEHIEISFTNSIGGQASTARVRVADIEIGNINGAIFHWYDAVFITGSILTAGDLASGTIGFKRAGQVLIVTQIRGLVSSPVEFVVPTGSAVDPAEVGTPISGTSAKEYTLQWDGTGIVNVLSHEYESTPIGDWSCNHLTGELTQRGNGTSAASGTQAFPVAFGAIPVVTATTTQNPGHNLAVLTRTTTQFSWDQWDVNNTQQPGEWNWSAFGPKP